MTRPDLLLRHAAAALLFCLMAVAWTWPLATHLTSHIPGTPGDNLAFLWNDWSMRTAIASQTSPFYSQLLFAPFGIDLTLHTHTAGSSWVAATLFGRFPVIAAHNLTLFSTLAMNGLCAYALAWDRLATRDAPSTHDRRAGRWPAAMVAGVLFGGSPYLSAHLLGHVNLLSAWGIPLFTLCLLRTIERRSWVAAFGAGLVVVATAFNDYYYVVYCAAIAAVVLLSAVVRVEWVGVEGRRRLRVTLLALLAIDAALLGLVLYTGGFTATVLGLRIAAYRPTNLLAAGWVLGAALFLSRITPWPRWRSVAERPAIPLGQLAVIAMVVLGGVSAIGRRALALVAAGDYTAPASSWRSGPAGVDLATVALGNPWHGWGGAAVRRIYDAWNINVVESVGWMGIAPLALAVVALTSVRVEREVRVWRWLGVVFFVWALGPWLKIGGIDTGLLLPQNLLAHLPIVSNARMPGRAMVVVFMALALLAAMAIARAPARRRWAWAVTALCLVVVDSLPAPFPLTRIDTPALYAMLAELPPGAVCELPVGVRDGFGMQGGFDDRVLSYQMTHRHPLVGGFAARIPGSVRRDYAQMPVVRSLLLLSEGKPAHADDAALTPASSRVALRQATIGYVVINRDTAPAALVAYVERVLPLVLLAREGPRELYVVE